METTSFSVTKDSAEYDKGHTGLIRSLQDGVASIIGLLEVSFSELITDLRGNLGLVLSLTEEETIVCFFSLDGVKAGSYVFRTFQLARITTTPFMLGHVVDSLGNVLNNQTSLRVCESFKGFTNRLVSRFIEFSQEKWMTVTRLCEVKAPGILVRQSVYEPLFTGLKVLDCLIPVGLGQRELIIGDRQTGKTALAVDVFVNQRTTPIEFIQF